MISIRIFAVLLVATVAFSEGATVPGIGEVLVSQVVEVEGHDKTTKFVNGYEYRDVMLSAVGAGRRVACWDCTAPCTGTRCCDNGYPQCCQWNGICGCCNIS